MHVSLKKSIVGAVLVSLLVSSRGGFQPCSAETVETTPQVTRRLPVPDLPARPAHDEHPLIPVLRMASDSYARMRSEVDDYTCVMVRRERVNGRIGPHEFIYAKVRNRRADGDRTVVPFSVYLKFLKPSTVAGREVLFVEGANDGEMYARRGGTRFAFVTTRLNPLGELAMKGNRHPVTEFGVENLLGRLVESARQDLGRACRVDYLQDAKINGNAALGIVVTQTDRSEGSEFYQSRIFVDRETDLPVHYEAYDWAEEGKTPELIEQYTYTQVKLNVGLNDMDFSADNPQYRVK